MNNAAEPHPFDSPAFCSDASRRASAYRFFASIFLDLPNEGFIRAMGEAGLVQCASPGDDEALLLEISRDRARLLRDTANERVRLPYESQFCKCDLANLLGELVDEYAAEDVHVQDGVGQPADYAGVELAFLSLFAERQVAAEEMGDAPLAQELERKESLFYRRHLEPWLGRYGVQMRQHAQTDFYAYIGELLEAFDPFENTSSEKSAE